MRKMINYSDFINESILELLLEANIFYKKDFLDILSGIDSPIKDNLLSLIGKEVDINQNFIDAILDKDDTLQFYQDDKVSKLTTNINFSNLLTDRTNHVARSHEGSNLTISDNDLERKLRSIFNFSGYVEREIVNGDPLYQYVSSIINDGNNLYVVRINLDGNDYRFIAYGVNRNMEGVKPSEMKVGRFVRALLKKGGFEFKDKEIEDFVNKYKSAIKIKKESFVRFEEVNGEDIRKWYLEDNYYRQSVGTLGGSCMRYSKCQSFLNIYVKNTKNVSMIILKPEGVSDKICGRAILWIDDSGRKIMDRVYTHNHADINFFIQYANFNGYYYKFTQNYEPMPLMFNGIKLTNEESSSKITLEYPNLTYYPYMDTFKYFNENGFITNDYSIDYEYELTDTNGGNGSCDNCGGGGTVECECCDGDKTRDCDECYNGSNSCRYCDGDGNTECGECDGEGSIECNKCKGEGCDDCNNGSVECGSCKGEGTTMCDECDGEGSTECRYCDGEGSTDCGCCDGTGRQDCYECN